MIKTYLMIGLPIIMKKWEIGLEGGLMGEFFINRERATRKNNNINNMIEPRIMIRLTIQDDKIKWPN